MINYSENILVNQQSQIQSESRQTKTKELQTQYSFDQKKLLSKQAKLEFIISKAIKDETINDFETVKYKGVNYKLGDYLQIHSTSLQTYVGQLIRIVKVPNHLEKLPFIQVRWCIKKQNLPVSILKKYGDHLSIAEVFPSSDLVFNIYIQSIKSKCFVLSEEEYGKMLATYEYYYFSRASYSHQTESLNPHPQTWKKDCICEMPINPDLVYIQCTECQKWFHQSCIQFFDLNQTYFCMSCQQKAQDLLDN